jgi:hypothetical protein
MPAKNASWFKIHCSLASCEAFQALDYKDQMTLIGLWMFAAESGRHILKADKRYLFRNIRILKEEPDIEPLLNAVDDYGRPNPFIRYCDAPVDDGGTAPEKDKETALSRPKSARARAQSKTPEKARAELNRTASDPLYNTVLKTAAYDGYVSVRKLQSKFRIGVLRAKLIIEMMKSDGLLGGYFTGRGYAYKPALEKNNTDKIRVDKIREEKREDGILTDSGKEKEERKEKTNLNTVTETQTETEKNPSRANTDKSSVTAAPQQTATETVKPVNPMDFEAGAVSTHFVPKQPPSVYRGGNTVRIADVLAGRFPEHWRDADCEAFGWEIVGTLGYSLDRDNQHSRGEWGAFAAWWSRVKAVVSIILHDEIRAVAVRKADYVRKKGKSARNKSAVWFTIMDGELKSRGITLHDTRASPAKSM